MQQKNTILFIVLSALIILTWSVLMPYIAPRKPAQEPAGPEPPSVTAESKPPPEAVVAALVGQATAPGLDHVGRVATALAIAPRSWPELARQRQPVQTRTPAPKPAESPELPRQTITLGTDTDFLKVVLDSKGGGVLSVTLPDFQEADNLGLPGNGPLELVPASRNQDVGSYLLYDCDPTQDDKARPYARLGKRQWQVADVVKDDDGTVRKVSFRTEVQDVVVTKTFTLEPGDYHLGLEIKIERSARAGDREVKFRYHLTSGHGLPIEGEWYTSTQRNAVVGLVDDNGRVERSLQYLAAISRMAGGNDVPGEGRAIQYAGVAVQYFSSLVVVDKDEIDRKDRFLVRARPTIENAVLRGRISAVPDGKTLQVIGNTDQKLYTLRVPDDAELDGPLDAGQPVAIVYHNDEADHLVARQVYAGPASDRLLFDDITVHVVSDLIDVKAEPVVHKYLLYNGPVKVRLLRYLEGQRHVNAALVDRYEYDLHLNTVTDFHDPSWAGDFFNAIGGTWLVIQVTNLMHFVLWVLHTYVMPWSYGVCILLLTIMVRGAMFPVSRRQALTSIRMQALAPEIKKLQEKYKDDRQALGMAQMELYRKHGVNPVGSCWTIFLQLPIFMGLYYCLQQSILFRLAPFLWIRNLAAPDMLAWWGESIPWISRPQDYGHFLYLGPFFNLLPVIVAAFMYVQQKMYTPPPADEQQEMQQRMMKFMTAFFGLMFYKLPAGLCLYFIASGLWGFAERQLLPKRKPNAGAPPQPSSNGLFQRALDRLTALARAHEPADSGAVTAPPPPADGTSGQDNPSASGSAGKRRNRKRRQERNRRREASAVTSTPRTGGESIPGAVQTGAAPNGDGAFRRMQVWWTDTRRKVVAWWEQMLRDARKR